MNRYPCTAYPRHAQSPMDFHNQSIASITFICSTLPSPCLLRSCHLATKQLLQPDQTAHLIDRHPTAHPDNTSFSRWTPVSVLLLLSFHKSFSVDCSPHPQGTTNHSPLAPEQFRRPNAPALTRALLLQLHGPSPPKGPSGCRARRGRSQSSCVGTTVKYFQISLTNRNL